MSDEPAENMSELAGAGSAQPTPARRSPPIRPQLADLRRRRRLRHPAREHGSLAGGGTTHGRQQDRADLSRGAEAAWRRSSRLRRPVRRHAWSPRTSPSPPCACCSRRSRPRWRSCLIVTSTSKPDRRRRAARVAFAMPALEIVGSRINNWDIGIVDTSPITHPRDSSYSGGPVRRLEGLDLRASADADDAAGRGRFRRERALRVSAIPSTRWLGWPANWRAATARCAPETSCSRVRSAPWFRSHPETGSWRRSAK